MKKQPNKTRSLLPNKPSEMKREPSYTWILHVVAISIYAASLAVCIGVYLVGSGWLILAIALAITTTIIVGVAHLLLSGGVRDDLALDMDHKSVRHERHPDAGEAAESARAGAAAGAR